MGKRTHKTVTWPVLQTIADKEQQLEQLRAALEQITSKVEQSSELAETMENNMEERQRETARLQRELRKLEKENHLKGEQLRSLEGRMKEKDRQLAQERNRADMNTQTGARRCACACRRCASPAAGAPPERSFPPPCALHSPGYAGGSGQARQ